MKSMSTTHEIAQWVTEQPRGTLIDSAVIKERMPWATQGCIAGALFRLSTGGSPLIELVRVKEGGRYEYKVNRTTLRGYRFRSAGPRRSGYSRTGPTHYEKRMVMTDRKQATPASRIPASSKKAALTLFCKCKLIRRLSEQELWDELERRGWDVEAK